MTYRTRTYIAGDWTNDKEAIDQLYKWNDSNYWGLDFVDVHQFHQSSDSSQNCSIKESLRQRMDTCKTFVIVIGNKTKITTAGSCSNCTKFYRGICLSGNTTSNKSYIQFECDKAVRDGLKIVVLYNGIYKHPELCPDSIRNVGTHLSMKNSDGSWKYSEIKNAIMY